MFYEMSLGKGLFAMRRDSYDHNAHLKAKITTHTSDASFAHAMKMYKIFACVSGVVLTVAYIISLMF